MRTSYYIGRELRRQLKPWLLLLPGKAVTSPVVSVLRSEEGKFHWSEQEVQTKQLPKLKNNRLLAPWIVTLASSIVTVGRCPRGASVFAARPRRPNRLSCGLEAWGTSLSCLGKVGQLTPQCPACPQFHNRRGEGRFFSQWPVLPYLKQAPHGVLLCPSSSETLGSLLSSGGHCHSKLFLLNSVNAIFSRSLKSLEDHYLFNISTQNKFCLFLVICFRFNF